MSEAPLFLASGGNSRYGARTVRLQTAFAPHDVKRYELPQLHAVNFVLSGVLKGGVTRSIALDAHGKSLAFLLLDMEIST